MIADSSAPWWSSGAFILLGAVATYIATTLNDRRKAKREDRQRWHADVRHAAAEFIGRCETMRTGVIGVIGARDDAKEWVILDDATMRATVGLAELQLVCSDSTAKAATALFQAITGLYKAQVQGGAESDPYMVNIRDAQKALILAVRQELGLVGAAD